MTHPRSLSTVRATALGIALSTLTTVAHAKDTGKTPPEPPPAPASEAAREPVRIGEEIKLKQGKMVGVTAEAGFKVDLVRAGYGLHVQGPIESFAPLEVRKIRATYGRVMTGEVKLKNGATLTVRGGELQSADRVVNGYFEGQEVLVTVHDQKFTVHYAKPAAK